MKFLEDEKLAHLTTELTDAALGERVLHGRIEAFSMKRAGDDKKFAFALDEKLQHEIEVVENEIVQFQKSIRKVRIARRSQSDKTNVEKSKNSNRKVYDGLLKRSPTGSILKSTPIRRILPSSVGLQNSYSKSPLGDFHHSCTRRLMTDLILTLNASFPDYDFSTVRSSHFARLPTYTMAVTRTNEKLSEFAATTPFKGVKFLSKLWKDIDDAIVLQECEVYSYVPPNRDDDDDPLSFLTQTLSCADTTLVPLWSFNFFFVNKSLKRIVLFTCVQTMRSDTNDDVDALEGIVDQFEGSGQTITDAFGKRVSSYGWTGYIDGNVSSREDEDSVDDDFDMDFDGISQTAPITPQIF